MTQLSRLPTSMNPRKILTALFIGGIALTGCSDNKSKAPGPVPGTSGKKTTTPPANYSSAYIRANLISPREVTERMREIKVVLEGLKDNKAPSCSLSGVRLPDKPEITTRQFTRQADPRSEVRYAQLVARYNDSQEAAAAFQSLQKKAYSCPAKRSVPPKRIDKDTFVFAHDDTWKIQEGSIAGWQHLRGHERQVVPPSQTRYNVFFIMYDYAVRGNVILSTLYMERTEPGKSSNPTAKRATDVLTRQLQKFG
jgi:hypothetical protein